MDDNATEIMNFSSFEAQLAKVRSQYLALQKAFSSVLEENARLRDEHYKDELVKRYEKKLEEMKADCRRGFPISAQEDSEICAWQKKHEAEVHGLDTLEKRARAQGVSGGRYTYEFTPTTLGVFGCVRCVCGAEFEFQDL